LEEAVALSSGILKNELMNEKRGKYAYLYYTTERERNK
jgi:predicted transcriptional regulator